VVKIKFSVQNTIGYIFVIIIIKINIYKARLPAESPSSPTSTSSVSSFPGVQSETDSPNVKSSR
jgi:hypothetical protein